jgi:Fe-S oxidoreductase
MLPTAKRWLKHILRTLRREIDEGAPVVGLEPSCVAVFRDEMSQLLPDHEGAKRLCRQTFTLAEFLNAHQFKYPVLRRKAVVHGHCHHKAVMKMDDERQALRAMQVDADILDNGCCGMAGSFGFEHDHFDVSMKVAEHELLPTIRRTPDDALILADGFSCRTQIEQATGRHALHLAEAIDAALRQS